MAQANPTGWEFLDQGPNEGLLNSAFDPDGARHFGVPPPHPPTRYGSPWFNRFGGRSDTVLNDIANIGFPESGFAPHAPEFRPKAGPPPGAPMRIPRFTEDFWKQNPDTEDVFGFPLTQPPWGDLDLLMATEQQQIEWQAGLTTAEAVVTQQIFNKGTLVLTKESTWASVFKRARWYDFNVPIVHDRHFPRNFVPETIESATQWKPGEAGNPTWRVLAPCIHLADLWLKQMAKGEWLRTLFFSHSERLHEGVDIEAHPDWKDVPGHGPQYWRREPDPDMEKATTVPAIATDIGEYIFKKLHRQYAPRIVWRLVDEDHYPVPPKSFGNVHFLGQTTEHCYTWHEDSDGGEDSLLEGNDIDSYFCTIDIHVQNIRPLISVDTTDHEKAIAMFKTAAGILHELMHAIDLINRRFTDKDIDNTDPDTPHRRAHEYYYKKEWIAELGASAMNSLFGGDLQVTPAVDAESAKGTRYMLSVYDFPSVQQSLFPQRMISKWLSDPDKGTHDIGSVTTQSPIPISWISAMLQKDFYKAVIEPLGLQAFRIPRVWDSKSRRAGYYTIVRPPQPKDPLDFPWHAVTSERFSTLIDQLEQTAKDVDARRTIWYKARPWQVMNQLEWRKTPYAFTEFRMLVMRFRELADPACEADFRRRFDPWAPLNLSVFREHQAEFLLKNLNDYVDKSDEPMAPNYWPMYVLSLMMRAAMPGRPSPDPDCKRETGPFWAPRNRWTPSSFTSAAHQFDPVGNPRWEFPEVRAVRPEQIVAKSRHTESYAEPDANRRVGMPDRVYNGREWKLIRAEQCLALYSEQYPIPNLLQAAIERQLRHLFIAAQERPLNEWLPFNFQFPAYHPSNLVTTHAVTRSDVLGRPRREVWYAAREAWHIVPFSALHQSVPGDEPPRLEDMYALKPEFARDRDFTIPGSGLAPHPSGAEGQGQVDATARVVREWFRDRFGPSMRRWRQNLSRRGPTDTASWPRWKKRPGNMPPRRYYSVSEVAENHWCLVMDEDGGYVVVDLSNVISPHPGFVPPGVGSDAGAGAGSGALPRPKPRHEDLLRITPLGFVVHNKRLFRGHGINAQVPAGYLAVPWRPEEIDERDGQHGRDHWIAVGDFVYDVTDLPNEAKILQEQIRLHGANVLAERSISQLPARRTRAKNTVDNLYTQHRRCGSLRRQAPITPPQAPEPVFTAEDLAKHTNFRKGRYCAIDGVVYDIGRYLENHPGGLTCLVQAAGKDVTENFYRQHAPEWWTDDIKAMLRVGLYQAPGAPEPRQRRTRTHRVFHRHQPSPPPAPSVQPVHPEPGSGFAGGSAPPRVPPHAAGTVSSGSNAATAGSPRTPTRPGGGSAGRASSSGAAGRTSSGSAAGPSTAAGSSPAGSNRVVSVGRQPARVVNISPRHGSSSSRGGRTRGRSAVLSHQLHQLSPIREESESVGTTGQRRRREDSPGAGPSRRGSHGASAASANIIYDGAKRRLLDAGQYRWPESQYDAAPADGWCGGGGYLVNPVSSGRYAAGRP